MKRRLFNLLAAAWLVLCVPTAGLWVHSGFRSVSLGYASSRDAGGVTRMWEIDCTWGNLLGGCPALADIVSGRPGIIVAQRSAAAERVSVWMPTSTQRRYAVSTQDGYRVACFYSERFRAPAIAWDSSSKPVATETRPSVPPIHPEAI